jgi:hypothetical protein
VHKFGNQTAKNEKEASVASSSNDLGVMQKENKVSLISYFIIAIANSEAEY